MNTSGQAVMTAESPKKYLFDNDFGLDDGGAARAQSTAIENTEPPVGATAQDEEVQVEAEAPPPPTYSEEDLARAREEGMQAGRDAATRDLASAMEQRLVNALETISTKVATLLDTYDTDKEQHSRDAVAVAAVMVRKLFPAINLETAMAEIEHMIHEAMKRTAGNSALIVRVPPDMADEVEEKAKDLGVLRGREGALSIIADKNLVSGDVAVEWEGGGMSRDTGYIWQEIDEIIERNLGKTAAPKETPHQPETITEPLSEAENPTLPSENV
ncbi:MAG TPA: FliH/SctL family protein [Magnetovibrio sp.]